MNQTLLVASYRKKSIGTYVLHWYLGKLFAESNLERQPFCGPYLTSEPSKHISDKK